MDEITPVDILNNRRSPRCDLVFQVEYKTTDRVCADHLSNLSTGGLFLRTESPFKPGERIEMVLSFPGVLDRTIVEGEVRWRQAEPSTPTGVGVAFRNLDPRARKQIDRLLLLGGAFRRRRAGAMDLVTRMTHPASPHILRVVLLESNPAMQSVFRYAIGKFVHGSEAVRSKLDFDVATDRQSCAALLEEKLCNIVIVDLDRLECSPGEMINLIRSQPRHAQLPVIGLSSESSPLDVPRSQMMVLRKPISLDPLFRTLSVMLVTSIEGVPS